jgi:hypothetical protein
LSGHTSILKTILLQFCPGDLFAAISTLLGSPIIGAFLLGASGLDGLLLGLRGRGKNQTGGTTGSEAREQPTAAAGADTDLVPG